jgi:two-component system, chemotaxis family, chemotaxis protein CheY
VKILIVDDHRGYREEVARMLIHNGHETKGAETAEEAIPLIESGDFDYALVDYSMPIHDGLWLMQHARCPRRTKALLVTAHIDRQMINRMFGAGICGYIIKPFDEEDLLRNLEFYSSSSGTRTGLSLNRP